jgi:hypothetical protein
MTVSGQTQKLKWTEINTPRYDERALHFGMCIGLNFPHYKIKHSETFTGSDTILSVLSPRRYGFLLGMNSSFRISDYWELRGQLIFNLSEKVVIYNFSKKGDVHQNFETAAGEIPLVFKYHSVRRKNSRWYLIAGLKPAIEFGALKKSRKQSELRTRRADVMLEYGIGAEVFYPYFKWAPEIRFSHGLVNILIRDDNVYSKSIRSLRNHNVTIVFNLE